jgi:hypothetical protein
MDATLQPKNFIDPDTFVSTMEQRWNTELNNVSSPVLKDVWRTICNTFNHSIQNSLNPGAKWQILNPPAGSGKSQGAAVYCSLLAKKNAELPLESQVGVLIVTRFVDDCNATALLINILSGLDTAITNHSDLAVRPTDLEMASKPILVVTHAAYLKSLEDLQGGRWTSFTQWHGGQRELTIVDESLTNVVEESILNENNLRFVNRYLSSDIAKQYPTQVKAVQYLIDEVFVRMSEKESSEGESTNKPVWSQSRAQANGFKQMPTDYKMGGLRELMSTLDYARLDGQKQDAFYTQHRAAKVDAVLKDIEAVFSRFAWYQKQGKFHSLNSSRLIIPEGLPAPCVLDATANQQMLWQLLEDRAQLVPTPVGSRNYKNVKLFIATLRDTGKNATNEKAATRFPKIMKYLQDNGGVNRKVLFVTHKDSTHHALKYKPDLKEFYVGHWGALDGKNEWKECDTVVIASLMFRPTTFGTNVFLAAQGDQPKEWFDRPAWRDYTNIKETIEAKQIANDVIQAVNRIVCRTVNDAEGNCPNAEVYLVLPTDAKGNQILSAIEAEMPGIGVCPWKDALDDEAKAVIRKGSSHEVLLNFIENLSYGDIPMSLVRSEVGLSLDSFKKLGATLKDPEHILTKTLAGMNTFYVSELSAGRAAKSYLTKKPPPSEVMQ